MPPVQNASFLHLPLGHIKPRGWLLSQLQIQANGLTGRLDEFWPSIADSRWIGGQSEGWERGPYWLDGLIPLAFLLDDEKLQAKAARWIDYILEHQHEDGWLGPRHDPHAGSGETELDPWPLFIIFKAFAQWHEATGDERILPAMTRAMERLHILLEEKPLENWAGMRWPDFLWSVFWLYTKTKNEELLSLASLALEQGYDWAQHFIEFAFEEKQTDWRLENHVVNNAMALKAPAMVALLDKLSGIEEKNADFVQYAHIFVSALDECHGQAHGAFSGDENLAGRNPSQGTETCAVVEYLFSLATLMAVLGTTECPDLCEQWERIAFNALPAPFTPDMNARQYDQQVNQVLVSRAERDWSSNGNDANLFSLEGNFGCCTANFHQGWPKFASHLWMRTRDGGFVANSYAPCVVNTFVERTQVEIKVESEYPFREDIRITVRVPHPLEFPLYLRLPEWCEKATLQIGGGLPLEAEEQFEVVNRIWSSETILHLKLEMPVRVEERPRGAGAIFRGPILFASRIGEEFRNIGGAGAEAIWEVHPTTKWNYGLELPEDEAEFLASVEVVEYPLGESPFHPSDPPVCITMPVREIERWKLRCNVAPLPPQSPVPTNAPLEIIELIPYGSTHLRVAEFPVVANENDLMGTESEIIVDTNHH